MSDEQPIRVELELLDQAQAYALAELCKRLSWHAARELAVDDPEARRMIGATDRLRSALERAGFYVR